MPDLIKTDILVIGAGSGGLSVAAGAAQMGAGVVLLEGGRMGGDCLNYGCVPSKALIAAGRHAHAMTTGGPFGIAPIRPSVDFAAAKDHVRSVIERIAPVDSQERFEGLGVRVIRAYGRFTLPDTVCAGDAEIRARRIVIATGSSPLVPPIPGIDSVPHHTNETIFDLRARPGHLIVVGGGPIGLELAQAHARLGSKVTVIETATALNREDPELAALVLDAARADGVAIAEGRMAKRIAGSDGAIELETDDGAIHEGTHLLLAVGRKLNIDRLDLDRARIAHEDGRIVTDAGLRTSNRRVYAIGDAAGGPQFTHLAGYHASVVLRSALFGLPAKARSDHIPRVTYTEPELAQVGLTEAEARKRHGGRLEVLRFPMKEIDRAQAERRPEGLIKVMVVRGRPVGASIVGAHAGELIHIWALAISAKLKVSDVASMVAPYPTLGEINKRAAGQYYVPRLFRSDRVKRIVRLVQRF